MDTANLPNTTEGRSNCFLKSVIGFLNNKSHGVLSHKIVASDNSVEAAETQPFEGVYDWPDDKDPRAKLLIRPTA